MSVTGRAFFCSDYLKVMNTALQSALATYVSNTLGEIYRKCEASSNDTLTIFPQCVRQIHSWDDADLTKELVDLQARYPQIMKLVQEEYTMVYHQQLECTTTWLKKFWQTLGNEEFVQKGYYFRPNTPPIVRYDCIQRALEHAFKSCSIHPPVVARVETSLDVRSLLFPPSEIMPDDSISNVGLNRHMNTHVDPSPRIETLTPATPSEQGRPKSTISLSVAELPRGSFGRAASAAAAPARPPSFERAAHSAPVSCTDNN